MKYAIEYVSPKGRFVRSSNLERDAGTNSIETYLPTGRALDVVSRLTRAIDDDDGSRAFSITGPYGTGKSSLAVFIDALLGPTKDVVTRSALGVLSAVDATTAETLGRGKARFGDDGLVRAVVTATQEPISLTLLRAILQGVRRFEVSKRKVLWRSVLNRASGALTEAQSRSRSLPTTKFLLDLLKDIASFAPIIIVIDEFGKNLEAFADSRSEADLYLLQELVEWSYRSTEGVFPVFTVTMQHLSFEEYLDTVSLALRREWAKVQGRFEDIPFIDTSAQTRHLIAQVHEQPTDRIFLRKRQSWSENAGTQLREVGLAHEVDQSIIDRAWPLHPSALLVLPDLCSRYGQNERTLFSFLASAEPLALPTWLVSEPVGSVLRDVRLDRVYDYFVDSAATAAVTSQTASRWVEVETSIRDASGLTDGERRVLKAVGLLNLVSAGGSVRASKRILLWACADGREGTDDASKVEFALQTLEEDGRITYREFADEYRLWRGSDLDLRSAVESSRRRLRQQPTEAILNSTGVMLPVVAARHSTMSGTLRVFHRMWDSDGKIDLEGASEDADGVLVYVVGKNLPAVEDARNSRPIVAIRPKNTDELLRTALELAAIRSVLDDTTMLGDDWVARRELAEREAEALAHYDVAFEEAVGHVATATEWWLLNGEQGKPRQLKRPTSLTAALSLVCDDVYRLSPRVASEMLNRHELTSQGARARRNLIEALLTRQDLEYFGIDGFPPERAMYDAVFGATGIHRKSAGGYKIDEPTATDWAHSWQVIVDSFERSKSARISVDRIIDELKSPPIGMKEAAASVLAFAGILAHKSDVALYEHGTYRPRMTIEVAERLLRNPSHFQVKHFASNRGYRRELVTSLADSLGIKPWRGTSATVLSVVGHLVSFVTGLPEYSKRTKNLSAVALSVRGALFEATEPDVLLFETLPAALGIVATIGNEKTRDRAFNVHMYPDALSAALGELGAAHDQLLTEIINELVTATGARPSRFRSELAERAERMNGKVLDQRLKGLLSALVDSAKDAEGWAEYVAMTVVGPASGSWSDDDRLRYLASIRELGGTLRRIEAIYFDRLATDELEFDALRLTVTRPNGSEIARVVGLDERMLAVVNPQLDEMLKRIGETVGDSSIALEYLLAALGNRLLASNDDQVSLRGRSLPTWTKSKTGRRSQK